MATLDLTRAKQAVFMMDPNLVDFASFNASSQSRWIWQTPVGHTVDIGGAGMTFDAAGRATGGVATSATIHLGGNQTTTADVVITGFEIPATAMDDGPQSFWRMLEADDTIIGPLVANAGQTQASHLFGDGLAARAGASTGGNDTIDPGDAPILVSGDVFDAGIDQAGAAAVAYRGGADSFAGCATNHGQFFTGDAINVFASGALTGGNDRIVIQSAQTTAKAVGDAFNAFGKETDFADVVGGNDTISAVGGSLAELVGDVDQSSYANVRGGNDRLSGGDNGEFITGDVRSAGAGSRVVGGADVLFGNGGADFLIGDVYSLDGGELIGANDILYGGEGDDRLYGERRLESGSVRMSGGNDVLYGGAGEDSLTGNTGNDLLDGGAGADRMFGGAGDDIFVTDSFQDQVNENAGEGTDTIRTTLNDAGLVANVENLTFIGAGNFRGGGNALSNRITGGGGDDRFIADGSGNDVFVGLGGFDILDFSRLGAAVINLATNVHGGSAAGDSFTGIESILGSQTGADSMTGGTAAVIFSGLGGNDVLRGGSQADVLHGGDGNDRLEGGAGDEIFLGGGVGNDVLIGGAGGDTLDGGDGFDTASYANSAQGVKVALDRSFAFTGDALGDTLTSIEALEGTAFADILRGDANTNRLAGGDGNDSLDGRAGSDVLVGGVGADTLTGGLGNDAFDYLAPNQGFDRIADFSNVTGNNDILRFEGDAFGGLPNGLLAANRFVANASGVATTLDQRFVYETDTGILRFDANGSAAGGVVNIAVFTGAPALSAADFFII